MSIWDDITSILSAPFVGSLDLYHLFALIGVIILMSIAWVFIIHSISATAAEMI
jgi:hypothetical protein